MFPNVGDAQPVIDLIAQGLLVTLIVQGLRAFNIGKADEQPRWALVIVGAIVYGAELVTRNLSPEAREIYYHFQPLVTVFLAMAIASGIFGYIKMLLKWRGKNAQDIARASVGATLKALGDMGVLVPLLQPSELDTIVARIASELQGDATPPTPQELHTLGAGGAIGGAIGALDELGARRGDLDARVRQSVADVDADAATRAKNPKI